MRPETVLCAMLSTSQPDFPSMLSQGANVLVSDTGHVFLADFGLACSFNDADCTHTAAASIAVKLQGDVAAAAAAAEAGASRSTLVGTTAFMAPEVINASHDLECYDQRVRQPTAHQYAKKWIT